MLNKYLFKGEDDKANASIMKINQSGYDSDFTHYLWLTAFCLVISNCCPACPVFQREHTEHPEAVLRGKKINDFILPQETKSIQEA